MAGLNQIERRARVLERISDSQLRVELSSASSCQRCARGAGCGAASLRFDQRPVQLIVNDRTGAEAGQYVGLRMDEDPRWLWVIAGAFGLPTLGILAGANLPRIAGLTSEWTAICGALAGLLSGIVLWRKQAQPRLISSSSSACLDGIETVHTECINPAEENTWLMASKVLEAALFCAVAV